MGVFDGKAAVIIGAGSGRVPRPDTAATRAAEPDEIARTALFLVSDGVGPMTGAVITHDGGATGI